MRFLFLLSFRNPFYNLFLNFKTNLNFFEFFSSTYDSLLSVASTVKLSSSLTSISLASPTEKNSLQNPFWYSLDGDDSFVATVGGVAGSGSGGFRDPTGSGNELRAEKRGAYYALAKNPDKYVSYQQAQQQTEDHGHYAEADHGDDLEAEDIDEVGDDQEVNDVVQVEHVAAVDNVDNDDAEEDDHDEEDDSEKIIHL